MNHTSMQREIGGIDFFMRNLDMYAPYVTLYCIGVLVGCTGNILIMGAIISTKELHTVTNMLIFNLAIADILISGFVDVFSIVGVFAGEKFFRDKVILCEFIAAVCLIACATSMINIGFLALNRFLNILYNNQYKKVFTRRNTLLFCLITWFMGFLVDLPNLVGWGGHRYDDKTLTCLWNRHVNHSYSVFFPMTTIVIPSCLIAYWYIRIFVYAYKSRRKTMPLGDKAKFSDVNRSIHISKGLFGSFALFVVCWLPYGLVVMSDYPLRYPFAAEIYTLVLAHLNSAFNPIFYAITNPAFIKGYGNFMKTLLKKVSTK